MREILTAVNPEQVQTDLGLIYVQPIGKAGVYVNAPHLTVGGVPLQASGMLVSNGRDFNFDLIRTYGSRTGRSSTADSFTARLVDGRDADVVILGKIAEVIVAAVRKFAEQNRALFLEAERRRLNNEAFGLEREIENKRAKLEEKERELGAVTEALKRTR